MTKRTSTTECGSSLTRKCSKRPRGLARNLLKIWPALWTFADHAGVQPTHNHAERALRGAVIYRKVSLGNQSEEGDAASNGCCRRTPPAASNAAACTPNLIDAITAATRGDACDWRWEICATAPASAAGMDDKQ